MSDTTALVDLERLEETLDERLRSQEVKQAQLSNEVRTQVDAAVAAVLAKVDTERQTADEILWHIFDGAMALPTLPAVAAYIDRVAADADIGAWMSDHSVMDVLGGTAEDRARVGMTLEVNVSTGDLLTIDQVPEWKTLKDSGSVASKAFKLWHYGFSTIFNLYKALVKYDVAGMSQKANALEKIYKSQTHSTATLYAGALRSGMALTHSIMALDHHVNNGGDAEDIATSSLKIVESSMSLVKYSARSIQYSKFGIGGNSVHKDMSTLIKGQDLYSAFKDGGKNFRAFSDNKKAAAGAGVVFASGSIALSAALWALDTKEFAEGIDELEDGDKNEAIIIYTLTSIASVLSVIATIAFAVGGPVGAVVGYALALVATAIEIGVAIYQLVNNDWNTSGYANYRSDLKLKTVTGGSSNDRLFPFSTLNQDDLYENSQGEFELHNDTGNVLYAGSGDDVIEIGLLPLVSNYVDEAWGGAGEDTISARANWTKTNMSSSSLLSSLRNKGVFIDIEAGEVYVRNGPNNVVMEFQGVENAWGSDYGDRLEGDGSANELAGFAGDDVLHGRGGDDVLDGGDDDDRLYGNDGDDQLFGGDGADRLEGGNGDDVLVGGNEYSTDVDRLSGQDGDDMLVIGLGAGVADGGAGDDVLAGGAPGLKSELKGGDGEDMVSFSLLDEHRTGYDGDISPDVFIDLLNERAVFDIYKRDAEVNIHRLWDKSEFTSDGVLDPKSAWEWHGETEGDWGWHLDSIEHAMGGDGDDYLIGSNGDNMLYGGKGDDILYGNDGNDVFVGGEGDDAIWGGGGSDTLVVSIDSDDDDARKVDLRTHKVYLLGADNSETLEDQFDSIENVQGGPGADRIDGDGVGNLLIGGEGDDRINGHDGDDIISGGRGADVLDGGAGIDTINYYVDEDDKNQYHYDADGDKTDRGADDAVVLHVDLSPQVAYWDDVNSSNRAAQATDPTRRLDTLSNFENVVGTAHKDILKGDANRNVLWGQEGDDTLEGRAGDDELSGGEGADYLDGGPGIDLVSYQSADSGVLVVLDSEISANSGEVESIAYLTRFSGMDRPRLIPTWETGQTDTLHNFENARGSTHDDVIIGTDEDNVLEGLAGADRMYGRGGDDYFLIDSSDVEVEGGAGSDTVSYMHSTVGVEASLKALSAAGTVVQVENLTGTNHDDHLSGDDSANVLTAGGGVDILNGLAGDDLLYSDAGWNQLNGGPGFDIVHYGGRDEAMRVDLGAGTAQALVSYGPDRIVNGSFETTSLVSAGKGPASVIGWDGRSTEGDTGEKPFDDLNPNWTYRVPAGKRVEHEVWHSGQASTAQVANVPSSHGSRFIQLDSTDYQDYMEQQVEGIDPDATHRLQIDLRSTSGNSESMEVWWAGELVTTLSVSDKDNWRTFEVTLPAAGTGIGVLKLRELASEDDGQGVLLDNVRLRQISSSEQDALDSVEGAVGSDHDDLLIGGDGANSLVGGGGDDRLQGGGGDDTLLLDAGADQFDGGAGTDVAGYGGDDRGVLVSLEKGRMFTMAASGEQRQTFEIDAQSDLEVGDVVRLTLGNWAVELTIGAGDTDQSKWPTLFKKAMADHPVIGKLLTWTGTENTHDDHRFTANYAGTLYLALQVNRVSQEQHLVRVQGGETETATATLANMEAAMGTSFDDVLEGDGRDNLLSAGAGDDSLLGWGGDDTIIAGQGRDRIDGGAGTDTLIYDGDDRGVLISLAKGRLFTMAVEGEQRHTFEINAQSDLAVGDVVRLTLGNWAVELAIGAGDTDKSTWPTLFRNAVAEHPVVGKLLTWTGAENTHDDHRFTANYAGTLYLALQVNRVSQEQHLVRVQDGETGGAAATAANGPTMTHMEAAIGSPFDDVLQGDHGDNLLSAGAGDDAVLGWGGDDTIIAGQGHDRIDGGAGTDTLVYDGDDRGVLISLAKGRLFAMATGDEQRHTFDIHAQSDLEVGDLVRLTLGNWAVEISIGAGETHAWKWPGLLRNAVADHPVLGRLLTWTGTENSHYDNTFTANYAGTLYLGLHVNHVSQEQHLVRVQDGETGGAAARVANNLPTMTHMEAAVGSPFDDVLQGDHGDNLLSAGAGDDRVLAWAGDDVIELGDGDDEGYGDQGSDIIFTGAGNDRIDGGPGDDFLYAGPGDNHIEGGAGHDVLSFEALDESVAIDLSSGSATHGDDDRTLFTNVEGVYGSDLADVITGASGDDLLHGGGGDDRINGGGGDDRINGGTGNNLIDGGEGNDQISFDGYPHGVVIDLEAGYNAAAGVNLLRNASFESYYGMQFTGWDERLGAHDHGYLHNWNAGSPLDVVLSNGSNPNGLESSDGRFFLHLDSAADQMDSLSQNVAVEAGQQYVLTLDLRSLSGDAEGLEIYWDGQLVDTLSTNGQAWRSFTLLLPEASADAATLALREVWGEDDGQGVLLDNLGLHAVSGVDRLTSIEGATGSPHDDLIIGDGGANTLRGGGGDDRIKAGAGDDYVLAGEGYDVADGGEGSDTISFVELDKPLVIDLSLGTAYSKLSSHPQKLHIEAKEPIWGTIELVLGKWSVKVETDEWSSDRYKWSAVLTKAVAAHEVLGKLFDVTQRDGVGQGGHQQTLTAKFDGELPFMLKVDGADINSMSFYQSAISQRTSSAVKDAVITQFSGFENVVGSQGADLMKGDAEANMLFGDAGGDELRGNGGDDVLNGGTGDDTLIGGAGHDRLSGGLGADRFDGGEGVDLLDYDLDPAERAMAVRIDMPDGTVSRIGAGGALTAEDTFANVEGFRGTTGDDVFIAGAASFNFEGGGGVDLLDLSELGTGRSALVDLTLGASTITGGDADINFSVTEVENVIGTGGDDLIIGSFVSNDIRGGAGDDLMSTFGGFDRFDGGSGDDTVLLVGLQHGVKVDLSQNRYTYRNNSAVTVTATLLSIETVIATDFDDELAGSSSDDVLRGGYGDDEFAISGGSDLLDGGPGADTVRLAGQRAVTADLSAGTASTGDTLIGIENLVGGAGDDRLTGDSGANRLSGGAGDDWLDGGGGADVLDGGSGVDTASFVGNAADEALTLDLADSDAVLNVENVVGGAGDDAIDGDSNDNRIEGRGGADTLTGGAGDDRLEGGSGDDDLDGGAGDDRLEGGDGLDFMAGGVGDDALFGGAGADQLRGGEGADELSGQADDDELWGGAGNDSLSGGAGNDELVGNGGADTLRGNAGDDLLIGSDGADRLDGGAGDDTLHGGGGNDVLTGGDGDDAFLFKPGLGEDRITDFEVGADQIRLLDLGLTRFEDLADLMRDVDGDVHIILDDDTKIVIDDVRVQELSASDFLFS